MIFSEPAGCAALERIARLGYSAVMQDIIIGGVAIVWGILVLAFRRELKELAKPGGRGFRNAEFLRVAIVVAGLAIIGAGAAIILVRAL